jgi:hypothetical protein
MAYKTAISNRKIERTQAARIDDLLGRLPDTRDLDTFLREVLDVAIKVAGADKATLQRFDQENDCLRMVVSQGFSDRFLQHFAVVHRDANTTCAASLKRRLRVVVDDVSTSYLFVNTPELDMMREVGVAAMHSTPIIGPSGRLWGVFTTHFGEPQPERQYDPAPLDRLAGQLADRLEHTDSRIIAESWGRSCPGRNGVQLEHANTSSKEAAMNSSTAPIPFGRSMLRQHRHVCAFFSSPADEYDALVPFICDGINCGQRAFHVLPRQHKVDHLQRLRRAGIDVDEATKSRQLEVALPEDTYLRTGRFDKDAMLALIQEALKAGSALGFPLTRMIAHAETAVDDWKSGNEWVEYEMRLNSVLPNFDDPVICTYDVNLLNANLVIDILRTHPVAIIGGVLVENSFFSRPDDFLREVRARTLPPQAYRG